MKKIELAPIGIIHSPYKKRAQAPPQGTNENALIEIFPEYAQGLKDLETFTHINIFYWLHKSKDYSLNVKTPWDIEPHGLFATRTPRRPNPIGFSVSKLLKKQENNLIIQGIDAIDKTPVIDIKPYIPSTDLKQKASQGWLKKVRK